MPVEANSSIGSEDLFKILLTQLNYQDPLKPMDNQEFIAQLAQFTTLEQTKQLNDTLSSLLNLTSSNLGVSLLNKTVEVQTEESLLVGEIITVSFVDGLPEFVIKTVEDEPYSGITMAQIINIEGEQ
ncbi:MAG: flagellar hook capping protein [Saccharospirillaceae bacterium]|nr:hypothetical protein [Pseudomonadales bacterium]NRB79739.1 flagellar hook capping protein [Saccharospirillaceae bacterium]